MESNVLAVVLESVYIPFDRYSGSLTHFVDLKMKDSISTFSKNACNGKNKDLMYRNALNLKLMYQVPLEGSFK